MKWIKLFENFQVNENIIIPGEYIDFVQMLKDHGIDTELYGTGTFKTIGHLYHEIEDFLEG